MNFAQDVAVDLGSYRTTHVGHVTNTYLSHPAFSGDISRLPTNIEDIPKDVLRRFGFILDGEESQVTNDEYDYDDEDNDDSRGGCLVIDEEREEKDIKPKIDAPIKVIKKEKEEEKPALSLEIFFCHICKKLTADSSPESHKKKHCFLDGCPELIESVAERERHKKMHDHPTKPMQCRLCKKRYRYYTYIEKHLTSGHCKVNSYKTAKENWRKVTAR